MLRNGQGRQPTKVTINCLIADGGLGDLVAALVPTNYIIKKYPWVNLLVWVPDNLLEFAKNVLPPQAIIRDYSAAAKKYDNNRIGVATTWNGRHSPLKTHPVDYAFHMLCDEHPDITEKNYLKFDTSKVDITRFNLPEKYVAIPIGSTARTKELPVQTYNEVAQYIKSKGYEVVWVGRAMEVIGYKDMKIEANLAEVDMSIGIDLTNKTNLCEVTAVIAGAKAIVGMDGGLMHVAGFTDVAMITSYTFVKPSQLMPIRNDQLGWNCYPITPPESLECRFCQSNINYVYDHYFKDCWYDDFLCTKGMTSDLFIEQLEKVL